MKCKPPDFTQRVFRQLSLLSFTCIVMGTWEWMLIASTQVLVAGGRAGMFWTYIWSFAGYGFLIASLAEMAAMAPTAGGEYRASMHPICGTLADVSSSLSAGQYHWVSEVGKHSGGLGSCVVLTFLSLLHARTNASSPMLLAGSVPSAGKPARHPACSLQGI